MAIGSSRGAIAAISQGSFNTPHKYRQLTHGQHLRCRSLPTAASRSSTAKASCLRVIAHRRTLRPQRAAPAIRQLDPDALKSGTFSAGAPWALCITPGPNRSAVQCRCGSQDGSTSSRWTAKSLGVLGESGKQAEAVRLGPRDRMSKRARDLRRRAAQLADAEADAPSMRTSVPVRAQLHPWRLPPNAVIRRRWYSRERSKVATI